jgi:hypothetical protein
MYWRDAPLFIRHTTHFSHSSTSFGLSMVVGTDRVHTGPLRTGPLIIGRFAYSGYFMIRINFQYEI